MDLLSSFNRQSVSDGRTVYSYDEEQAGEYLGQVVCNAFVSVGQSDYANVVACSQHKVEGRAFSDDPGPFWSFAWVITAHPSAFARLATAEARDEFKEAVKGLGLGILENVHEIRFEIEHRPDADWRTSAKEALKRNASAANSAHPTVSQEALTDFMNAAAEFLPLRIIDDAFRVGGIALGKYDGFASGERRTRIMDYVATVDQKRPQDAERMFKALAYMLDVLPERGATPERTERLRSRLYQAGFDTPVARARQARPEPKDAVHSTNLVEEVIGYLRAVPRGLRELTQQHRHDNRQDNVIDIADEYDLQDFVRAFLKMRFPHASVEDPIRKTAGLGGRVDFTIGDEKLFIELKVLRAESEWSAMHKDIASKFERYSADGCSDIIVFVYDPTTCFREAHNAERDMTKRRRIGDREFDTYLVVAPKP